MSTWQEYVDGHAAGCTKAPLSAVAGFRVQALGLWVQGLDFGFRIQGLGFSASGLRFSGRVAVEALTTTVLVYRKTGWFLYTTLKNKLSIHG